MKDVHPKAIAAIKAAAMRRHQLEIKKTALRDANKSKLRFVAIDSRHTLCFYATNKDVIQISTAIRSPTDRPCKIEGRWQALQHFLQGHTICLRKPPHMTPREFIVVTFAFME